VITLITGLPGNGKTLYAIQWTLSQASKPVEPGGPPRPVFYSGITDVRIPGWVECDAEKWMDLPPGAIVLIDEVQRLMRPRIHGSKVPTFIAELETHRHRGVDLVLITQHPMLLDSNVRRLTGQHFHVIRKFGTHAANIYEWGQVKENADKNRSDSQAVHSWAFPAALFGTYKSAEVHTHKRRIPMKVWILLALPFLLGAIAWYTYNRLMNKPKGPVVDAFTGAIAASGVSPSGQGAKLTNVAYVQQFLPRVPGLAYTAPAYDEITKPITAPYPAACVRAGGSTLLPSGLSGPSSSEVRCRCYTQQGTRIEVPRDLCESIVDGGFFVAWQQPVPPPASPLGSRTVDPAPQSDHRPAIAGIVGSRRSDAPSASVLPITPTETLPPGRGRSLPPLPSRPN
jgi:hypothetical protein